MLNDTERKVFEAMGFTERTIESFDGKEVVIPVRYFINTTYPDGSVKMRYPKDVDVLIRVNK